VYTRRIDRWLLTLLLVLGMAALPSFDMEAQAAMDRPGLGEAAAAPDAPSLPEAAVRADGESKPSPFEQEASHKSRLCEDEAPEDVDDADEVDGLTPPEVPDCIGSLDAVWPPKAHDLALLRPPQS
jgi:hypothetical protein